MNLCDFHIENVDEEGSLALARSVGIPPVSSHVVHDFVCGFLDNSICRLAARGPTSFAVDQAVLWTAKTTNYWHSVRCVSDQHSR